MLRATRFLRLPARLPTQSVALRSVAHVRGLATRAADDSKSQEAATKAVMSQLTQQHQHVAERIVPWFFNNMPASYFRQVGEQTRSEHLKALAALQGIQQNMSMTLTSKFDDVTEVTFIRPGTAPSTLVDMLDSMPPADGTLSRVKVYTANDNSITLNIFTFGKDRDSKATLADASRIVEYVSELRAGKHRADPKAPAYVDEVMNNAALQSYISKCQHSYVVNSHPRRFLVQRLMYQDVIGTDKAVVNIEPYEAESNSDGFWVTLAAANVLPKLFLHDTVKLLNARGLNLQRVHLDVVKDDTQAGSVTMLRTLVTSSDSAYANLNSPAVKTLKNDLQRLKWLGDNTLRLGLTLHPFLGLERAEIITAYCSMLHGPLNKINAYAFSRPNIFSTIENKRHVQFAAQIADLFIARFNPDGPLSDAEFKRRADAIRESLSTIQVDVARTLLDRMLQAVEGTLRTNFFMPNRYALSMRVKPEIMVPNASNERPLPYGVFFVHGRHFNGFHNRFRDIARGGLRIVTPPSEEQHAIESARQYDEVYGLSYAQQLKNKDIPEGGAKGVVLVDNMNIPQATKFFAVRTCVKAFTDAVLDLIVKTPETQRHVVDYFGKPELLYLGPDEQIIPEDINWIVKRAAQRGYFIPAAFMSSKPDAGINHKQYGVTSEGVAVYLSVALRTNGIDPTKQPFTVKMTGGPDGDVAGNMIKILSRDYGRNARIVGIADGSGSAEDPDGLDHEELLRLFYAALPIGDFNRSKLGSRGRLYLADNEEGIRMRNTLHNRVPSDIFVPAGGRPNTINESNWQDFIVDGKPSSPLIVEGANLFLTPQARLRLFETAGVRIVKDSSANKCGVITSSYEICSSMLLSHDEFMGIKEELVQDVLKRLRELAQLEAELLFREFNNYPGALPYFSERISGAINKAKDALGESFKDIQRGDALYNELMPLFHEHLPKKLVQVAANRIDERVPLQYIINAFASSLASKLVYREGIHFIESQPVDKLSQLALRYYREERRMRGMISDLESSSLSPALKNDVIQLVRKGGVRASLGVY